MSILNNLHKRQLYENEVFSPKRVPDNNPEDNFEEMAQGQKIMLFDIDHDPRETKDISNENEKLVKLITDKIIAASRTMRRGNFNLKSVLGHPFFYGGNFSPGWCRAEK